MQFKERQTQCPLLFLHLIRFLKTQFLFDVKDAEWIDGLLPPWAFARQLTFLPYIELGPTYYEEHKRETVIKHSIKKLKSLGHKVTVEPVAYYWVLPSAFYCRVSFLK